MEIEEDERVDRVGGESNDLEMNETRDDRVEMRRAGRGAPQPCDGLQCHRERREEGDAEGLVAMPDGLLDCQEQDDGGEHHGHGDAAQAKDGAAQQAHEAQKAQAVRDPGGGRERQRVAGVGEEELERDADAGGERDCGDGVAASGG